MQKILEFKYFPLIAVVFLTVVYFVSDFSFIQCRFFIQCESINSAYISQIDERAVNLSNVNTVLTNKLETYQTRSNRVRSKEDEIEQAQQSVDKKSQEIRDALSADANANVAGLNAEKTKLEAAVKNRREEANTLVADREKTNTEIAGIRNQVAARYSNRLLWVFLTAVFFALCVSAIGVSWSVIKESIKDEGKRNQWLFLTSAGAFAFALFVSIPVYLRWKSHYMSIVMPMYEKSFGAGGDLSLDAINFINALGFGATIFMLAASCSLIAAVQRKKQNLAGQAEAEKAEAAMRRDNTEKAEKTAKKSEKTDTLKAGVPVVLGRTEEETPEIFEKQKTNAKVLLYIGGLMLFVAMLRIKLTGDWHLAFISSDVNSPYYKLLADFLKNSLAVQAGFYTIILAAIYLPVLYAINSQGGETAPKKEEQKSSSLLGFSLADVLPRLIAIISPFLAGPLLDFLKYFTTK